MRAPLLLAIGCAAACSDPRSRLDAVLVPPDPTDLADRAGAHAADTAAPGELDEDAADLERKLRELTAQPLGSGPLVERGAPLTSAVLGGVPGPFGPLAPLRPGMTRDELRAAVPTASTTATGTWVPTGLADTTAELAFDRHDRLVEIVLRLPLSARPLLIAAWGTPGPAMVWLDRDGGWRTRLTEDAIGRRITLAITSYAPFAMLIAPGGLADPERLLGATAAQLVARDRERVFVARDLAFAELELPRATDACSTPGQLAVELAPSGAVARVMFDPCFDDGDDSGRRLILAALEQRFGPGIPRRTDDGRPVLAWTVGRHAIEAQLLERAWRITAQ